MIGTLGEILPRAARFYGDRTALAVEGRRWSFSELDRLTRRCAAALAGLGVAPGDRVTLYAGNCVEWIIAYHGALKAGAVINPINVMLTPEEVAYVVDDCGARVLFTSADKAEALLAATAGTALSHVITFGGPAVGGALDMEALLASARDGFASAPRAPTDISTIGYTSGTTGHPKGAMLTHRAVLLNAAMTATMHMRTDRDSVVTALPCAHVYGNVVMNGAFLTGMTLHLMPRFDPDAALGLIGEQRATMFEGVPTMYLTMLDSPRLKETDLSSLTRCTVGGQTMPVPAMEAVEEAFGAPLLELWGMTEIAGLGTTHSPLGPRKLGSIGTALPFVEARIADAEDGGRELARGEVGELMIRGPFVMKGYYGNEAATAETIRPDGWLHTGDVGSMDETGHVTIVDRKKDMILTGGYNVYPAEIERVLAAHPSVAISAVGRLPDPVKGEIAKAYVVLKRGAEADEAGLMAFARERLAAYKCPRAIKFVDDLPRTSTGKIRRKDLAGAFGD